MCADVNILYLNTLRDRPEYMHLALNIIPQEIIDKYNLLYKAKNGYVYINMEKTCMACHRQADLQTTYS
jgi:hypothetical protein